MAVVPTAPGTQIRSTGETIILVAAAILIFAAILNSQPLQSANDRSRWSTVWSLVERGTYRIDEIDQAPNWATIDKVRHRSSDSEPWHFYSSKPPLLSTIVAGVYWLERQTLGLGLFQHTTTVSRLLLLLINGVPMVLALISFRNALRHMTIGTTAAWFLLITAGCATMLNPFLTTLNNHTPAAISLMFCLTAMLRIRRAGHVSRGDAAIVGFTAALTCCFELPAALFGVLSFLFVVYYSLSISGSLFHSPRPDKHTGIAQSGSREPQSDDIKWTTTTAWYVVAAVIPLAGFFITNWICTGGIKPFYTYYGTEKYVYVHEGIPSYWANPQGMDANQESPAQYLFHCILGHHGILSMSPVLLLTLAGWWMSFRRPVTDSRNSFWKIGSVLTVIVLTFYLTRTENYNYGGNTAALRWLLWLTPLWLFGMIPAVDALLATRRGIAIGILLLIPSVYSMAYSLNRPWQPGWIFRQMETAGWIDYHTKIPPFDPARHSVLGTIPEHSDVTSTWVEEVSGKRLTLTTGRRFIIEDLPAIGLQVIVSDAATVKPLRKMDLLAFPTVFSQGLDVSAWLRTTTNPIPPQATSVATSVLRPAPEWVVEQLRGLPGIRPYNSASARYLSYIRSDGQKWALKCDRGAARLAFEDPVHGLCWQRCDIMYCEELPFGVARWSIVVEQESTRKIVHQETWTCRTLP